MDGIDLGAGGIVLGFYQVFGLVVSGNIVLAQIVPIGKS